MEVDVGRVIAGKYRLVRLLGRGSMGEVWFAHHQSLNEHVALKLLTPPPTDGDDEYEDGATAAARFQFEAQLAAKLSKKTRHIVRVTDHGQENGLAYLVMELLEGETLDSLLERQERVPLPTLANIVGQVARALNQAHAEGVAHRDLKPANVFLTHDEDGKLLVKLLDFGIARAIHAHRMPSAFSTAKGLVFGTPSYMSPEQALASARLDHRCDLWALATMAFEGATGKLPVDGDETDERLRNLCAGRIIKASARAPDLGEALDSFFDQALADSITKRFQSASELAIAFARAAGAPPERDVSAPSLPNLPPDDEDPIPLVLPRRSPRRTALIATGVVVTCAVVGAAWHALTHPPEVAAATPQRPAASSPAPVTSLSLVPPVVTLAAPSVPVSALPQATTRPGGWSAPPSPAPTAPPAPVVVSPPTPTPTSPPPAPAPAPAPSVKKDRSEVF